MENKKDIELKIPLTIEKQLENYSKREGHTDRHETLWHAWYQNKRWIGQLLQITLNSFPTYSRHDETHALSVLNNIEMILGQERIAQLSATECFVLLHTVYIHDIGMCITQRDRKEIIENEAFIDMIEQLEANGEESVKKAIKVLKCTNYVSKDGSNEERIAQLKHLYRAKLDVYYAIIELMANYRRMEHGEKSAERLYEWTMEPAKLGTGFSMAGVPLRIFLAIARSAQMHTCNNFEEINKLPRKDGGYASDYYHPRFISVLLMLGDLLDMDNDRFHPMVFEFVEEFPETSKTHYDKHRAIRKLNISPDVIEIEADCQNQNALRLVRKECDMLVDILHNAGYLWSSICPEGFHGSLPSLSEVNLYLKGKQIPEELVTAQFNISQKKAFSILEGSNLYEGRFIFLREFLQNAIDASKLQYWNDYMGTAAYYYSNDVVEEKSPTQMNQELSLDKYPIEIGMKIQRRNEQGKTFDISEKEVKEIRAGYREEGEYGVLVSVKDFGTGIDKENIIAISKVGNSRIKDRKNIQKMPKWLRPTAEFGVGLQSAFLLTGSFKCYTHTRSGERYEITFSSGASSRYEGYINVVPIEHFERKYESYGTCFEVFVPLEKKFLHSESICTWSGSDPFEEDYDNTRILRHTAELISQMALYLDGMLGEVLFPVILRTDSQNILKLALNTNKDNLIHKIQYQEENIFEGEDKKSWIFRKNEEDYLFGNTENSIFALEYDTARLHIWSKKINAFCAVSGANLMRRELEGREDKQQDAQRKGIMIYYKGIELQHRCMEEDIEIFEYIDIKGSLERSYINISRRGFTVDGEKYFEKVIYKNLLNLVREVLQFINKEQEKIAKLSENIIDKISGQLKFKKKSDKIEPISYSEYQNRLKKLVDQLLSLAFLSHLAVKDVNDELSQLGKKCGNDEPCVWQRAIEEVRDELSKPQNRELKEDLKKCSVLFDIQGYEGSNACLESNLTILDLFSSQNHYGVLQTRDSVQDRWTSYIISVEQYMFELFERRMLSEIVKTDNTAETDEVIERWSEKIFDVTSNIGVTVPDGKKYQQQFLLTWLIKNIPTIGIFSNEKGNKRFNVLGNYIYPYIYTDKHNKKLIVERILEISSKYKFNRFSSYAWQGRQYLEVKELPFSCFFIKRGYLNKSSMYKVIIPVEGKTLCDIQEAIEKTGELVYIKNVKLLMHMLDFKGYFSELLQKRTWTEKERIILEKLKNASLNGVTSLGLDIDEFFRDIMSSMCAELSGEPITEAYFQKLVVYKEEWNNTYLKIIDIFLQSNDELEREKEIENLKKTEGLLFIFKGWYFVNNDILNEISPYLQTTKLKEQYIQRCYNDAALKAKNQRIVEYILKHGRYPMKRKQLEICLMAFTEEIFKISEDIEKEKVVSILQNLLA